MIREPSLREAYQLVAEDRRARAAARKADRVERLAGPVREVVIPDARKRLSKRERYRIHMDQAFHCARCGELLPYEFRAKLLCWLGEFDHIVPLELGGANDASNIECLCPNCHKLKTKSDIKAIAKARRLRAKNDPSTPRKAKRRTLQSRGFQ